MIIIISEQFLLIEYHYFEYDFCYFGVIYLINYVFHEDLE